SACRAFALASTLRVADSAIAPIFFERRDLVLTVQVYLRGRPAASPVGGAAPRNAPRNRRVPVENCDFVAHFEIKPRSNRGETESGATKQPKFAKRPAPSSCGAARAAAVQCIR